MIALINRMHDLLASKGPLTINQIAAELDADWLDVNSAYQAQSNNKDRLVSAIVSMIPLDGGHMGQQVRLVAGNKNIDERSL